MLENEVDRALKGIDDLVNMVVSEAFTRGDFLSKHQNELDKLREMVKINSNEMAKINEKG